MFRAHGESNPGQLEIPTPKPTSGEGATHELVERMQSVTYGFNFTSPTKDEAVGDLRRLPQTRRGPLALPAQPASLGLA